MKTATEWLDIFDDNLEKMTVKKLIEQVQADALEHAAKTIEAYAAKNADILDSMNPISVTKTYLQQIRAAAMPNSKKNERNFMKYKVKMPFVDDMGSISDFIASESRMETKEENALWTLNRMRGRDGLKPWTLDDLPEDMVFEPIDGPE